jgi:transposase
MATNMSKSAISNLMRTTWRTVGKVIARVVKETGAKVDRFANLKKIGVDEISYRKGHRYLTVVVDHDSGRLIWATPGKDEAALNAFFDKLGEDRTAKIELVSSDAAAWYTAVIQKRCPKARLCLDPFHVVKWATEALDEVRRDVWNDLRKSGRAKLAESLKRSRYALWKNPENLTPKQSIRLAEIAQVNKPLYRAYLLKEQLREVFKIKGIHGIVLFDKWRAWARRSKIAPFVELAKNIKHHRTGIVATLAEGLTNARVEAMNTKLRLITRIAFGFHSPEPMIALAMLRLGGLCPPLPGRG